MNKKHIEEVNRLIATYSHDELAGMYWLCSMRELELKEKLKWQKAENERLKLQLSGKTQFHCQCCGGVK
jgi:hypothetical protein